jgi:hypothetical protein
VVVGRNRTWANRRQVIEEGVMVNSHIWCRAPVVMCSGLEKHAKRHGLCESAFRISLGDTCGQISYVPASVYHYRLNNGAKICSLLFNDAANTSQYLASNYRVINKLWNGNDVRDVEVSRSNLCYVTFCWRVWGKPRKHSAKTLDYQPKFETDICGIYR